MWPYVQLVNILFVRRPFKSGGCNVFHHRNTRRHYKYPNKNLRTFVEFLDQWIYTLFRPAPPRTASRIFTLAPPRRAPRNFTLAPPCPTEKCSAPHIPDVNSNTQQYKADITSQYLNIAVTFVHFYTGVKRFFYLRCSWEPKVIHKHLCLQSGHQCYVFYFLCVSNSNLRADEYSFVEFLATLIALHCTSVQH